MVIGVASLDGIPSFFVLFFFFLVESFERELREEKRRGTRYERNSIWFIRDKIVF